MVTLVIEKKKFKKGKYYAAEETISSVESLQEIWLDTTAFKQSQLIEARTHNTGVQKAALPIL